MILIDGEERDHKEQPYSERQYVLIRKHLMKGSSAEIVTRRTFPYVGGAAGHETTQDQNYTRICGLRLVT